jgi:hypothetical protein
MVAGTRWVPGTETGWTTDCRSHYGFDFDIDIIQLAGRREEAG